MNIVLCGNRTGFDATNHKTNKMCEGDFSTKRKLVEISSNNIKISNIMLRWNI